jgi:hypothetical protein
MTNIQKLLTMKTQLRRMLENHVELCYVVKLRREIAKLEDRGY